jgi:hypothetical protein
MLFTAGPRLCLFYYLFIIIYYFNTSYQEEAKHKTGSKKAEDQATELNLDLVVKSVQVALPEDGIKGCQNM